MWHNAWMARHGREIAFRLLEPVTPEANGMIEAEAHRLETWLGSVRFTPRFRTPLEQELDT